MKKRQKQIAAVTLALSVLAAPHGIPAGVLAESKKNQAGIRGYIAESEGYAFAEFPIESSLEETGTADGQDLTEMGLQTGSIGVQVETAEVSYQKADWNGSTVIYSGQTAAGCIQVESSTEAVTWNESWYVVNSTVIISEPITVSGAVNLILTDGCTLTAEKGIVVTDGNSLNIYAQSGGTGTLTATGTVNGQDASAGIGGASTNLVDCGSITIHGGVIHAASGEGYYAGAGIGGGSNINGDGGSGNNITIYGGSVTAESRSSEGGGAGIGGGAGGYYGGAGEITICGGTVRATGGKLGAGIGGGTGGMNKQSGNGTVTISGGEVTAVGGDKAAGIGGGGGYQSAYFGGLTGGTGTVTVNGGIVDAKGGGSGNYAGDPIGNGVNASDTASVNKENTIVFENGAGTVCGNVNFDGNYEVPADYSLHIPAGASLSGNGTLSGGGTFTIEMLTEDMISVPEDWSYTGEDLTEQLKGAVSLNGEVIICGQTFTASADGWELSVEKVSDLNYTVKYTHDEKKTLSKTVTIAPRSMKEAQVIVTGPFTYNGQPQTPAPTVTLERNALVKGTDYTVAYANNTNAGSAMITVTGRGNYAGAVEKTFIIDRATPTLAWETAKQELIYTGREAVITAPKATGPEDIQLDISHDTGPCQFSYAAQDGSGFTNGLPTNAGTYTIRASVAAKGNYAAAESTNTLTLTIKKADQNAPDAPSATEENIRDTSITLAAVENAEYSRDGTNWQDSPVFTGLEANQAYTFHIRLKADKNHNVSPGSAASITTRKTMLDGASVTVSGSYTYNGAAVVPAAGDVTVILNGTEIDSSQYAVSATDNINAGKATVTVTAAADGDYSGSASTAFTIGKAALTIRANNQAITYGGSIAQGTGQVTASGLCGSDNLGGITLTASNDQVAAENKTIMPSAAQIQNAGSEDVSSNYRITYQTGTLTINKAQGMLTVPETPFNHKKFGDAEFSLNCSTNGDGRISYVSSNEGVVTVSADGTALITGAGTATVTVSLAEGANYTEGAKDEIVTVTVEKADAPSPGQETRNYTYAGGSKGNVTIDVSGKFPADRGATAYTLKKTDNSGILSGVSVDENGNLAFTVPGGQPEADTASITVTAEMANYKDATYTVKIELVEKIAVNFTLTAQPQDSVYDGKPHNGYAGFAAQTVNGSYTGAVQFWYAGTGGTPYDSVIPPVRAGSYTVTASVPEDDAEYTGASEAVPFTIRRAAITIKADNKTAQAGSPLPELTYTVSGLAEKEQLKAAPELSCSADMNTAGIYPVTAGGAEVPDTDNYQEEITYENGTLTVLDSAVHVTGVSLDKSTLLLAIGSTGQLTAALSPENATDRSVSWVSNHPAVASVDSSGNITAVSAGTAVITVTAADGGYTASCTVTVRKNTGGGSGGTGSGSFGSSGSTGSSGGSGSTGSGPGQAAKQPFLKDSSGREGWDVIRAEAETAAAAPAGGTVAVDMNGAVSVPGSVFEGIRGKNVTVSLDMGNGITWSVNGKDITADSIKDTDFSVKADAGAVPKGLIEEKAGGLAHMELSLAHEGGFGFTATLTLRLVSRDGNGIGAGSSGTVPEYTGMYANLFYYNPALRSLEFICAGQIREDGTADLPFTHASDYTVILSAAPMGGTGMPGDAQEPGEAEKPQEPAENARPQVKSVTLSRTLYTYNGKPKKPSVIAVDTEGRKISGRYYTVSYKNNKKAGKAAVTVRFKGDYSGTVKMTFTICPVGTSVRKLTAASGGFTVKWKKKTAQVSGYQIQYSTNRGFKGSSTRSVSVKKTSATKKEVKNLKAGKKYYVRIRTYKTVKAEGKNTKVYSAWSGTVQVRTLPASGRKNTASAVRAGAFPAAEREDGRKREA